MDNYKRHWEETTTKLQARNTEVTIDDAAEDETEASAEKPAKDGNEDTTNAGSKMTSSRTDCKTANEAISKVKNEDYKAFGTQKSVSNFEAKLSERKKEEDTFTVQDRNGSVEFLD